LTREEQEAKLSLADRTASSG